MIRTRRPSTRRARRPSLESLEGRQLLSTFTVTSTADDGTDGTLRAAIAKANNDTGQTRIELELGTAAATIALTSGVLDLTNTSNQFTYIYNGPDQGPVTISGNGTSSVFWVEKGVTAYLTGMTITGGKTQYTGGGVDNIGTTTLQNCTISGNSARQGGGGLYNHSEGRLALIGCAITNNTTAYYGGGVNNLGTTTLQNCTISGNSARQGGGGFYMDSSSLTLTACTVSGNSAGKGVGGLQNFAGTSTLTDTIVAGNTLNGAASDIGGDSGGGVTGSNNLIGTGGSGGITNSASGNIVLTDDSDAGLGTLGSYGGTTETIPLLPGSFAIAAGVQATDSLNNPIKTDQRGELLDKTKPDIGAFQSQGFVLTPVAGSTPQSTNPGSSFANQLQVKVTANNPVEPVDGGWVNFSVPSSGASAVLEGGGQGWGIVKQGSIEYAGVNASANNTAGSYVVTASTTDASPVHFQLSNIISLTFSGLTNPSIQYGSSATFSGKLANGSQAPGSNESVTVTVGGISQKAAIGAGGAFSVTINTASLNVSGSPYNVAYSYTSDGTFSSANATGKLTITKGTPTIALTSSAGSAVHGQSVSFVATVTSPGSTATGTVTFSANGKALATVSLNSSGTATYRTSDLALGASSITATYNGNTNLATATSATVSESVAQTATQIVLVTQPIRKGKKVVSIELEAMVGAVAPGAGVPTLGTVTFEVKQKKKFKILGSEAISNGKATLTVKANSVMKKPMTINFSGSEHFLASTVSPPAITKTSLTSMARPMSVFLHSHRHGHHHGHRHHGHA